MLSGSGANSSEIERNIEALGITVFMPFCLGFFLCLHVSG